MKRLRRLSGLALWAARDLARRPWESALVALALAASVAVAATPLLLEAALRATAERVLAGAPSIVVRRVGGGGFLPVAAAAAVPLGEVPGVRAAWPRTWGVVPSPHGPLTVVGVDPAAAARLASLSLPVPSPGTAVLGPGVEAGAEVEVGPAPGRRFRVAARLPERSGLVAQATLLVTVEEAAALLGLEPGQASDLAVTVGHVEEETAIQRDLARVLPWPVRFMTRREALGAQLAGLGRLSGTSLVATLPALLALVVLVAAAARDRFGSRREAGLLKALGWTTGDVAAFGLLRALVVGAPAATVGAVAAAAAVFWPGPFWAGRFWLGWTGTPPALALDPGGVLLALLPVAAWILLPWLVATGLASFAAAATDPADLLVEEAP